MGAFLASVFGRTAIPGVFVTLLVLPSGVASSVQEAPDDTARRLQIAEIQRPVAQFERRGVHLPPVDAPITDPFRAPEHDFGPGNRGIEYGTTAGVAVTASADGTVSFAGTVAGSLFVSIDHGGGLITTIGFLDGISVSGGDVVAQGDVVGSAGERTHFSARQDGVYFDPQNLFGLIRVSVRLVANAD